nr:SpoIIE family protein phosphatase [Streptomyces sp. NBC_01485]
MDKNIAMPFPPPAKMRSVPDGAASIMVGAGGVVIACSPAAGLVVGYDPMELVGRTATDLLAAPLPATARLHCAGRTDWSGRIAVRHRDGHRVELELAAGSLLGAAGDALWVLVATPAESPGEPRTDARDVPDIAMLKQWALDQLPLPIALFDRQGRASAVNAAMAHSLGEPQRDLVGRTVAETLPGYLVAALDDIGEVEEQVTRAGVPVTREVRLRAPGEALERAWLTSLCPVKDEVGRTWGMSMAIMDMTEQYRARQRLSILNEAGLRIGTTLDLTRTADELAEVGMDHFADFVIVDLLDSVLRGEETETRLPGAPLVFSRAAQRSVLPGCPESVVPIGGIHTYHADSPPGRALSAGRAISHRVDNAAIRDWAEGRPERAHSIRKHGIHSLMLVPLRARGVTLGLAVFCRHRTPDYFDDSDLLLAEELAARAAVCVDNARRYARERATALVLQGTLLPHRMPGQAAVEVASRYLPADAGTGVGGDWFDVIPLSGQRVALVVGDVVGHGIEAAATMGRLCTAVRTLADVDLAPDELLTRLDDLVLRLDRAEAEGSHGEVGATCLYAVYDPSSCRCTMARAGHPLPALATPDGKVEFLDLPAGPPLGLGGLPFEVAEFELPEGSVLALYTDGLIEAAGRDMDEGCDLLHDVLAGPGRDLEKTCDRALRTLMPDGRTDDAALLLARTHALDAEHVASWYLPAESSVVVQARALASDQLAAWHLGGDAFTTELVVSELVTNAIRYGSPPIRLRLIRDTTLICEVSDASIAAPHLRRARVFDEGGRGLLIVAQLSERWGSRHTRTGKTIWAQLPLPS